jgi:predicted RNA binding protein YcfA (HicA-like mRNA interferase family)
VPDHGQWPMPLIRSGCYGTLGTGHTWLAQGGLAIRVMGERMPRISGWDLGRALERAGWVVVRQEGDHAQMTHPAKPGWRVTVIRKRGDILPLPTLKSALIQAGMTVAELKELL